MNNTELYGVIYMIINTKNNKRYIGQTTNGFNGRYYKGNWEKYTKTKALIDDINKYGRNVFYVIEEFDYAYNQDELDSKEIFWIEYYDSFREGYNGTKGATRRPENYEEYKSIILESDLYKEQNLKKEYEQKLDKEFNKYYLNKLNMWDIFNIKTKEERYTELYHKLFLFSTVTNVSLFSIIILLLT